MPLFGKRNREKQISISDSEMQLIAATILRDWYVMAQDAWAGYKRAGAGFVVISRGANVADYAPFGPNPPLGMSASAWNSAVDSCADYDPSQEIIFLFRGFTRRGPVVPVRQMTPRGMRTPPESYEESMAELREALASGETTLDQFLAEGLPQRRRGR